MLFTPNQVVQNQSPVIVYNARGLYFCSDKHLNSRLFFVKVERCRCTNYFCHTIDLIETDKCWSSCTLCLAVFIKTLKLVG